MRKIIRMFFLLCVILGLLLAGREMYRNRIETIIRETIASLENKRQWDDFALSFRINYLSVIPIGEASLCLEGISHYQGNPVYRFRLQAEDSVPFSWLKPAKAEMTSYADTAQALPRRLLTRIEMDGGVKSENELIYNQGEGYMVSGNEKYVILPETYEPLSLTFYLMRQDFSPHKTFDLNLNSNQANYRVKVEVKSEQRYRIQERDYRVWELDLSARRRRGGKRHSLDAKIYFLETPEMKVPLLARADTNLGRILLRLQSVDFMQ